MQSAVEAGVLDLDAAVHHDGEPLRLAVLGGILVPDAELHPDGRGADGEGDLGTLTISGNDNEVDVDGAIDAVQDNGERNEIDADNTV